MGERGGEFRIGGRSGGGMVVGHGGAFKIWAEDSTVESLARLVASLAAVMAGPCCSRAGRREPFGEESKPWGLGPAGCGGMELDLDWVFRLR